MKLEEIENLWKEDCVIDEGKLASEAARIPVLHQKYYALLIREVFSSKKLEDELNEMNKMRHLYYTDVLTDDELLKNKWTRIDYKPLRTDVEKYMMADKELQQAKLKWFLQDEKVTFLKSILSTITNRGYLIKSMIDWKRFESGG